MVTSRNDAVSHAPAILPSCGCHYPAIWLRGKWPKSSEILGKIGNTPAFFFLDPFGTKGIPFTDLLPLLNRIAITEVVIVHLGGRVMQQGAKAA
jgi:hypothetical protein